jgi:hypothetical protein
MYYIRTVWSLSVRYSSPSGTSCTKKHKALYACSSRTHQFASSCSWDTWVETCSSWIGSRTLGDAMIYLGCSKILCMCCARFRHVYVVLGNVNDIDIPIPLSDGETLTCTCIWCPCPIPLFFLAGTPARLAPLLRICNFVGVSCAGTPKGPQICSLFLQ